MAQQMQTHPNKRQSISFPGDLILAIEDFRAKQRPIPTFQEAVLELVQRGLKR